MTCRDADERYATARVMGASTAGLLEHAEACPRKRWTHALPSSLHYLARDNRARAEAFRLWESELRA